jgi:hypothetical protein|tara:strand:+ start:33 stop:137 length:105 start_codon:yes stop_codon:yes gene_type:complete
MTIEYGLGMFIYNIIALAIILTIGYYIINKNNDE